MSGKGGKGGKAAAAAVSSAAERFATGIIRLIVPAGKAAPAPPVGPALGQKGLNLMEFCKAFNDQTKIYKESTPIPVLITAYSDRTFTFITKTPTTAHMLKLAAGIPKGTRTPGKEFVGEISLKKIYEIAKVKQQDQSHVTLEGMVSQICANAHNIGLKVVR
jgi:large subunit ribosomal protein L11